MKFTNNDAFRNSSSHKEDMSYSYYNIIVVVIIIIIIIQTLKVCNDQTKQKNSAA